ncbi:hypothetical protein ACQEU3_04340 [Spirillospora sp. CA-253888]
MDSLPASSSRRSRSPVIASRTDSSSSAACAPARRRSSQRHVGGGVGGAPARPLQGLPGRLQGGAGRLDAGHPARHGLGEAADRHHARAVAALQRGEEARQGQAAVDAARVAVQGPGVGVERPVRRDDHRAGERRQRPLGGGQVVRADDHGLAVGPQRALPARPHVLGQLDRVQQAHGGDPGAGQGAELVGGAALARLGLGQGALGAGHRAPGHAEVLLGLVAARLGLGQLAARGLGVAAVGVAAALLQRRHAAAQLLQPVAGDGLVGAQLVGLALQVGQGGGGLVQPGVQRAAGELVHLPLGGLDRRADLVGLLAQPLLLGGVRGVGRGGVHQQPRLARAPEPHGGRHLGARPVAAVERPEQRGGLALPFGQPLGRLDRLGALAVLLGARLALGLQLPVQAGQRGDGAEDALGADLVQRLGQQVGGDLGAHRGGQERHAPHPPAVQDPGQVLGDEVAAARAARQRRPQPVGHAHPVGLRGRGGQVHAVPPADLQVRRVGVDPQPDGDRALALGAVLLLGVVEHAHDVAVVGARPLVVALRGQLGVEQQLGDRTRARGEAPLLVAEQRGDRRDERRLARPVGVLGPLPGHHDQRARHGRHRVGGQPRDVDRLHRHQRPVADDVLGVGPRPRRRHGHERIEHGGHLVSP